MRLVRLEIEESVSAIFRALGLPVPHEIVSQLITDDLSRFTMPGFSYVPPCPNDTPPMGGGFSRLTKYNRIAYDVAKSRFGHRHALRQEAV